MVMQTTSRPPHEYQADYRTITLDGPPAALGRVQASYLRPVTAPFRRNPWEEDRAFVDAGCAVERLGLDLRRSDLAEYLLDLRATLEAVRSDEEAGAARATFAQLVPSDVAGR